MRQGTSRNKGRILHGHQYGVFISYSHADEDWVWSELLPRLKRAGAEGFIP